MNFSEVEKKLSDAGCYLYRNESNHPIWYGVLVKILELNFKKQQL